MTNLNLCIHHMHLKKNSPLTPFPPFSLSLMSISLHSTAIADDDDKLCLDFTELEDDVDIRSQAPPL